MSPLNSDASPVAIPVWTAQGILPPVDPAQPIGPQRSPYRVSLADVILRFGTSRERRQVLDGFLRYRAELHRAGLVHGFQWLDGSFLEDVERLEGRPPRDVDVVTFLDPPEDADVADLFDHKHVKAQYFIDHYVVELSLPSHQLVTWSAYWYGVWSHRRDLRWKGYLEIDLAPAEDEAARANLSVTEDGEAWR